MKVRFLYLFPLGCICLWNMACQKELSSNIIAPSKTPQQWIASAKQWHYDHFNKQKGKKLTPLWEQSWTLKTSDKKDMVVVPAPEKPVLNPDITMRRFFIFTTSGQAITDGKIIELQGLQYNVNDHIYFLLTQHGQEKIKGFNGAIFQYNINYYPISNAVYRKGKRAPNIYAEIVTMPKSELDQISKTNTP